MKTNYRFEGPAGPPVVTLTHPLGVTLALWDDHVAPLTKRFRVLRYDVRGHGVSEIPPGPYTLEQMAGDLFDLLDSLGIEETHFVGGLIGMTAALSQPRRIESLERSSSVGVRSCIPTFPRAAAATSRSEGVGMTSNRYLCRGRRLPRLLGVDFPPRRGEFPDRRAFCPRTMDPPSAVTTTARSSPPWPAAWAAP